VAAILGDPEALAAEIRRRAHQKAVETSEEARRRAAAILEGATEQSESIRRQFQQDADRQIAALLRRNAARAELEAKRRFVLLREAPIEHVWQAAEQRLRELVRQPTYLDVLKRCVLRAARELSGGELVLAADPLGHELLSPKVLEQWSKEAGVTLHRANAPAKTWGGLLATSGRSRFDATFPTQLAEAELALRERVFKVLSGGEA